MSAPLSLSSHSNLESFLDHTTPSVPLQSLLKRCTRNLNNPCQSGIREKIEYFTLRDLWDQYDECSAYGAGAPIILANGETVVQYYVPYLSAIQIYTSKPFTPLRNMREESDVGEFDSDSWSEDNDSSTLSRTLSNDSSRCSESASEDSSLDLEGVCVMSDRRGYLYCQYFESCPPYGRIPLMDKVNELSRSYPGLMSLKSIDLLPASWMAVAWYPIYHIPTGRNVKDLSASFLTFHGLSLSVHDNLNKGEEKGIWSSEERTGEKKCKGESSSIALSPFGLATYKMKGNLWVNPETLDHERIIFLLNSADSWLKQLRVKHPDFNYFSSHSV